MTHHESGPSVGRFHLSSADRDLMALIETRDLWKSYQMGSEEIHALSGVSIEIERGEYVAIWDRQALVSRRS